MGIFEIFTAWLTLFSISFTFLPIFVILDWRKRGTAEGFSSVNFVLPILMMSCWFRYGYMTNDKLNIYLNAFNLVVFAFYILAFAYYQPKRKYLYGQLASLGLTIWSLFRYVDGHPEPQQPELMAAVAAATQIAGLAGGIYDVKRAVDLKTTEYIPAQIQFGIFFLTLQWTVFGIIKGNYYMAFANVAGLVLNIVTLALYFVYPPRTWRVPIFGTGPTVPTEKKKKKA